MYEFYLQVMSPWLTPWEHAEIGEACRYEGSLRRKKLARTAASSVSRPKVAHCASATFSTKVPA
jgi:hypothetical protein